ncbi:hypothetical protein DT87_07085 [Streptomyces sp. NTK 937]|nr:hypothetical protein DT87_07085 [Streptomyces sp. NTK 937]
MRNRDSGGAPSASLTSVLIGVTWVTSSTVRPAYAAIRRSRVAATRSATSVKLSPPPVGAASGEASQALRSEPNRSRTSANVSPSHAPKSVSRSPSSIRTSRPSRSATAAAVSRQRRSGELTISWTVPRAAKASAARAAWSRPVADSPGSPPPLPENRFSGVRTVSPCRSSTNVAGEPRSGALPQPTCGACAACGTSGACPARAARGDSGARAGADAGRAAAIAARTFAAPAAASPGGPDGSGSGAARGVSRPAVEDDGSHCPPRRPASMASLASRSACLFSARGIHSYVTEEAGRISAARAASGFMSGCLIFQRPDICSTTSLESIRTRTRTSVSGNRSRTAVRPAISPRYSATLLDATPMNSAASASTCAVSGSMTTAP